jgi:hypothetical protein
MDTYSISTHDGATVYGGVESAKLNWTNLEVQLTAEAAAALGLSRKLVLLVANLDEAESARDGLRRVGIVATAA